MTRGFLVDLKDGDPDAFADLVRMYTVKLRRIALTFFHSPFEQEEALQETFLHIFRQRALIDPERVDAFEGFLTTLARRKMIDMLRASHPESVDAALEHERDRAPSPHELAEAHELQDIMTRFEERLKPGFQPYFRAVFINGQDEEQARIALAMGRLRARYVKRVLVNKLRKHHPLLERLERMHGGRAS